MIEQQLVREVENLRRRTDNLVKPEVLGANSRLGIAVGSFSALPGLVGFWPMSSVQRSTGNAYDLSGQGRTLTYNGNPTYNIYNSVAPYIDCDGTGDFLRRSDETDLDILGTETIYASTVRGLALGGWFRFDRTGSNEGLMAKWTSSGSQASYDILRSSTGVTIFRITNDGSTSVAVSSAVLPIDTWHFIAGVFTPSTSMRIFANGVWVTNTTSIPASIFSGSSNFTIGATENGAAPLDGKASLCFLCANALPQALISSLYSQTRPIFGV